MEVFDAQSKKLVGNVTSRIPLFNVGGLQSGSGFDITLYAMNRKGKSPVSKLQAFTLKSAEKRTGELKIGNRISLTIPKYHHIKKYLTIILSKKVLKCCPLIYMHD